MTFIGPLGGVMFDVPNATVHGQKMAFSNDVAVFNTRRIFAGSQV